MGDLMTFKATPLLARFGIFTAILACPIPALAQYAIPVMDDNTRQLVAIAIVVYILPSFIALWRKHPSKWSIVLVNLLLGATGIGWIVALIWSFGSTKSALVINNHYTASGVATAGQNASTLNPVANKSVSERVADLKAMLDSGAISQAEFELLKTDALKAIS